MDWISKKPVPPGGLYEALQVANSLWPESKLGNAARLFRGEVRAAAWRFPLARRFQTWRLRRATETAPAA
jgi:hypothetical protein